jgi:hypothetical protein
MKRDTWEGGGHSTIWGLPETHPFQPAFVWHDRAADKPGGITAEDDKIFLLMMKALASHYSGVKRLWLLSQARVFYSLAVGWRVTVRRS